MASEIIFAGVPGPNEPWGGTGPYPDLASAYIAAAEGTTIMVKHGTPVWKDYPLRGLWLAGGPWVNRQPFVGQGWLPRKAVHIVGIGGVLTPKSYKTQAAIYGCTDRQNPLIWICGEGACLTFENITEDGAGGAQFLRIGIPPTGVTTQLDYDEIWLQTPYINFTNCGGFPFAEPGGIGPTVQVGGRSWMLRFDRCNFGGNPYYSVTDDRRAAMVFESGPTGLVNIIDVRLSNGGIRWHSLGAINVHGSFGEGDFISANPPAVDIFAGEEGVHVVQDVQGFGDSPGTVSPAVRVAKTGAISVIAVGCGPVEGPATVIGARVSNTTNRTIVPEADSQSAMIGPKIYGDHEGNRFQFAPAAVRYINRIRSDVPTSWTVTNGDPQATFVTCAAPWNPADTTRALEMTVASGQISGAADLCGTDVTVTLNVGDWLIIGCWLQQPGGFDGNPMNATIAGAGFSPSSVPMSAPFVGAGEWQWVSSITKFTTIGTNPVVLRIMPRVNTPGKILRVAGPVVAILPNTVGSNDAYRFKAYLQSYPRKRANGSTDAVPGDVVCLPGLTIA